MKMRKIFAILLSTALLMALAIVPTSAAETTVFKADYTTDYTWDAKPENAAGYLSEGTVELATDGASIDVTGAGGRFAKRDLAGKTAFKAVLSATGTVTVSATGAGYQGACLKVELADGTYRILDNVSAKANGTYTAGEDVTVEIMFDATNTYVVVNGTAHLFVTATDLPSFNAFAAAGSQTPVAVFQVQTVEGASANVKSYSVGTATASLKGGSENVDVIVNPTEEKEDYIEITLVMGAFDFTYTPETYRWDADANQYVVDVAAEWEGNDDSNNAITVTNLSSIAVKVEVTTTVAANTDGVTFALSATEDTLDAATAELVDSVTITGEIGGTPGESYTDDGLALNTIGTITVAVYRA